MTGNGSAWGRLSRHLTEHVSLYIFALVLVAAITTTARFPVYFRADDIYYMSWAAAHTNPLHAFIPSEGSIFAAFRPLNTFTWWLCWRLFGLNPAPYQFFIGLLYGTSFVFLFKLVALAFSRGAAVLSLLAYLAFFSGLTHIVFWFADMTFVLEALLINLSLYLLVSATIRKTRRFVWGVLALLGACLAKEPAMLIVPAVAAVFLATRWATIADGQRRRAAVVFLTVLAVGVALLIGSRHLHGRLAPELSMGFPAVVALLGRRLRFYGTELLAGAGVLIWVASVYLALASWAKRRLVASRAMDYLFLALATVGGLLATRDPGWGLALLYVSFALILASRAAASAAAVWAALPLIAVLTTDMMTRTYLVEASFGLVVLFGVAAAEVLEGLRSDLRRLRPVFARSVWGLIGVLVCVAVLAEAPAARERLKALSVFSAASQNFRDVVVFARDRSSAEGQPIIILDYDELGIDYGRDVRDARAVDGVRRKKMMVGNEVQMLLRLDQAEHVDVHNLQWYRESGGGQALLVAMNRYERDHVLALGLDLDPVYEVERSGEGAWVYRLGK